MLFFFLFPLFTSFLRILIYQTIWIISNYCYLLKPLFLLVFAWHRRKPRTKDDLASSLINTVDDSHFVLLCNLYFTRKITFRLKAYFTREFWYLQKEKILAFVQKSLKKSIHPCWNVSYRKTTGNGAKFKDRQQKNVVCGRFSRRLNRSTRAV